MFSKKLRIYSSKPITIRRFEHSKAKVIVHEPTQQVPYEPENLTPHQTLTKIAATGLKRGDRPNESILLSSVCEQSKFLCFEFL